MEDLLYALLFDEELTADQRAALRDRFDDEPAFADAWAHWCAIRMRLRRRVHDLASDRRLLVLYVMEREGDDDAFTPEERAALDAAREDIQQAVKTNPVLEQVVERIQEEHADFEEVWDAHPEAADTPGFDRKSTSSADHSGSPTERNERAPAPPRARNDSLTRRWTRRLVGASLVVVLAVTGILFWTQGGSSTATVAVEEGQVRTVELADGSVVRLVGAATFSYPTDGGDATSVQRVTLDDGRAYFDVQPDGEGRSFVVETPTATATVLGTQFGVSAGLDTTDVVLASGSLRVDASQEGSDEGVVLDPGQRSTVGPTGPPAAPTSVDLTEALDWTGLFIFRSVPLETIVERLSHRFDVQIMVSETLAAEPVTGTFEREQSVEQILRALAATLSAEVEETGPNQYQLVPSAE